jgi:hypothetical protein
MMNLQSQKAMNVVLMLSVIAEKTRIAPRANLEDIHDVSVQALTTMCSLAHHLQAVEHLDLVWKEAEKVAAQPEKQNGDALPF